MAPRVLVAAIIAIALLSTAVQQCSARTFPLDKSLENRRHCLEIFGSDSWWGYDRFAATIPEITIRFQPLHNDIEDPILSIVVFHKNDGDLGGLQLNGKTQYICTHEAINASLCSFEDYGAFIGRHDEALFPILSTAVHLRSPTPVIFPVTRSGAYCVEAIGYTVDKFQAWARFETQSGNLPAIQLGKLQFSLYLTVLSLIATITVTVMSNKYKGSVDLVFTGLIWLFFAQSSASWANLTFVNYHGYGYQCEGIRTLSICLVALRYAVVFYLWSRLIGTIGRPQNFARLLSRVLFHVVAAASCFLIVVRENEILQERDESRDTTLIGLTLAISLLLLAIHAIILSELRFAIFSPQEHLDNRIRSAYMTMWRFCGAMSLLIACLGLYDLALLLSWINADEYGHDLLSLIWKVRWFFLDEWHTMVCIVDILCIYFVWSSIMRHGLLERREVIKGDYEPAGCC